MEIRSNNLVVRRGFTIVELLIGIVITSMVFAAMTTFTLATASAWKANQSLTDAMTTANLTGIRLTREFRNVRAAGAVREGSLDGTSAAALVLWRADTNADSAIQLSELEVLGYDPTTKVVSTYKPPAGMTDEVVTTANFNADATITRLLKIFTAKQFSGQVETMRLYKTSSGTKAGAVEAQLKVKKGDATQSFSVVVVMRSGAADPT